MYHIQTKFHRTVKSGTSFRSQLPSGLLPNRVVPLEKIMSQFVSGRPIDASLQHNLPFNDVPFNPLYRKDVDLADLPDIAQKVGQTLQEFEEQVKAANAAANLHNPDTTPPEQAQPGE